MTFEAKFGSHLAVVVAIVAIGVSSSQVRPTIFDSSLRRGRPTDIDGQDGHLLVLGERAPSDRRPALIAEFGVLAQLRAAWRRRLSRHPHPPLAARYRSAGMSLLPSSDGPPVFATAAAPDRGRQPAVIVIDVQLWLLARRPACAHIAQCWPGWSMAGAGNGAGGRCVPAGRNSPPPPIR